MRINCLKLDLAGCALDSRPTISLVDRANYTKIYAQRVAGDHCFPHSFAPFHSKILATHRTLRGEPIFFGGRYRMTLAFHIIRAAHATGTHHKLALDALRLLHGPDAQNWRRFFLANAKHYVEGSKAPDKEFKDFKNHVLHPSDDYWGGAPEKARNWYRHLVNALKAEDWTEAAWCAGILSHYFTDPVQPFHTAQSEAENAIHRATEWSISKSYDSLIAEALQRRATAAPSPGAGEHWLQEYVCLGAETSHQHYERLLAHYDINVGVVDPQKGLDLVGRQLIGDLLVFAKTGFAHILDRALAESGITPPRVNLAAQAILAGLTIPVRWVLNRIEDAQIRRQVEAMHDELLKTGKVEKNLPDDDRAIRELYKAEVLAPRAATRAAERAKRVKSGRDKSARLNLVGIDPALRASTVADTSPPLLETPAKSTEPRDVRHYLELNSEVEAAPSIGRKMSELLEGLEVLKVSDLLEADPAKLASGIADSRITESTVNRWQDEARLMLSIPGLRVSQSKMLVGAGYRFSGDIAEAEPQELSAAILAFASTQAGRRILRDGEPPDIEKIKAWIDAAHATSKAA